MKDHSEESVERTSQSTEQKIVEQRDQLAAQHAVETRRAAAKNIDATGTATEPTGEKEVIAPHERRSASTNLQSNEGARLRRGQLEGGGHSARIEELAHAKNLSETQRQEALTELENTLDKTDPHWREADRRVKEAEAIFKDTGPARREFCHMAGTAEHTRWEEETRQAELKSGRIAGRDFDIEAVIHHPDGNPVRLDYVDYRKDIIVDRKPIAHDETEQQLMARYEKQRIRHIEAYEHKTSRKVMEYQYSLYPSPRDE